MMLRTAVDTSVLVEVLGGGPRADAALQALTAAAKRYRLVIFPPVWAELLVVAPGSDALAEALAGMRVEVDWRMDREIWLAAVGPWGEYLRRRKRRGPYPCPACGHRNKLRCAACGDVLAGPRRMLPDFLIGAHAKIATNGLITWDRGIYSTYFPTLVIHRP